MKATLVNTIPKLKKLAKKMMTIEEFAFDYDIYVQTSETLNAYYRKAYTYEKQTIRGSLQTQGLSLRQSKSGNTETNEYEYNYQYAK